ncbi:MAG: hypothetical protein HYU39_05615 [Thaumarchaeota archaeon]|nr:hypothetical protein [Nitrososphaerota archaeon]
MSDEKIRIRVKLGVNEVEVEGIASALEHAANLIPRLLEAIPSMEETGSKATPASVAVAQSSQIQMQKSAAQPQPATSIPEVQIGKDDSLTDVIVKIFGDPWGRQPRKLNQVREVLESYGLIYPKQSVAVSLLRLAQSGKLRRFKGEGGEFVYVASTALSSEARPSPPPVTDAPIGQEAQETLQGSLLNAPS